VKNGEHILIPGEGLSVFTSCEEIKNKIENIGPLRAAFNTFNTSGSEATPQGGEQKEEGRGGRLVADATQVIDG